MGDDMCVSLCGGDVPHIGAVALAVPRPSLQDSIRISSSVSVLTVLGHKEDELARKVAHALACAANCIVSVSCGIHLDNPRPEELAQVLHMVDEMVACALEKSEGAL